MKKDFCLGYCYSCEARLEMVRRGVNHPVHLLLTVLSCGLWGIVWAWHCALRDPWRCRACGRMDILEDHTVTRQLDPGTDRVARLARLLSGR